MSATEEYRTAASIVCSCDSGSFGPDPHPPEPDPSCIVHGPLIEAEMILYPLAAAAREFLEWYEELSYRGVPSHEIDAAKDKLLMQLGNFDRYRLPPWGA